MIYTINVTKDHIGRGKQYALDACPIALAIKEEIPTKMVLSVSNDYITNEIFNIEIPLPEVAESFIYNFDENRSVSPFSFEIDIPEDILK